ncbi:Protein SIP5 [Neonectria ditissima]|uniref:Protein SIP5 n=1 Tax=Neonectria ditissima TaxID=78410 RepID=A0A0P7BGU7_9HYPO|nr:Protein SIP5 [Neonectria ditissima]
MGNSSTKESRPDGYEDAAGQGRRRSANGDPIGLSRELAREAGSRSRNRTSRPELNIFGLGSSSSRNNERQDAPFERRETRQEREARKLEKERAARAKERERSIREEHVDGGYLVTLGTYTGTEDFSKPVIERKLAPFWRGLSDWSSSWNEHQLIAAARGLPVPAADATPDPELIPIPPPPADPRSSSSQNLHNLTVPMGPRSLSVASDRSGSAVGSSLPSPSSAGPAKPSSPFKPRAARALAALSVGSRNASSTDLGPKEMTLSPDPFVNGQPTEVFLYKDADDCPICFLSYPPYLNHTRCCDQPICTECFVQIKRAEPHLREHHPDGETRDPNEGLNPDDPPEMLISEPSACPYCQQPEFGVTYEPPPFRRGLVYSSPPGNFSSATAMSSQSSLNSTLPPTSPSHTGRRRTHSLSANAPNVITTDRVRPDWASKLATARAHQARRAAAATALHTAAFLMGGSDQRSSILRPGRFSRRNTGNNSSSNTPIEGQVEPPNEATEGPEPGARGSSRNLLGGRRNRMDELEEMMFMEAVRLSLAAEEDRKRKEEKQYRKDAKKREKEERKAAKKQGGNPYSGTTSGASASSLSLGIGRRRGNSAASNLRMEATVSRASQHSKSPEPTTENKGKDQCDSYGSDKGKGVDRGTQESQGEPSSSSSSLPLPATATRGGSHLRQMSNASSIGGSSNGDSPTGSFTGPGYMGADGGPRSSGLSLGGYSDDGDRDAGSAGSEPMFNFSSLAQMVGADIDGSQGGQGEEPESPRDIPGYVRPLSQVKEEDKDEAEAEHVEERGTKNTLAVYDSQRRNNLSTPELTITPETPAPGDADNESKQLGFSSVAARTTRLGQ